MATHLFELKRESKTLLLLFLFLLLAKNGSAQHNKYFKDFSAESSPQTIGKNISEHFLQTPHTFFGIVIKGSNPTFITYPDACAWYGAFTFAKVSNDIELKNKLLKRTELLLNEEAKLVPKPNHVDNRVVGIVPLEAYLPSGDNRFLVLGRSIADEQFKKLSSTESAALKPDVKEWYESGLSWQTRFWIDDMFMITSLQSQAYLATHDKKYIDQTAKEMVAYLDKLQNENGLFYHAPDAPFYWGRGNGWMAAGMAELLSVLPKDNSNRKRIMQGYLKMMKSLLQYQDANGMWHQLIDDANAWPETSATGMFSFAFITGVKNGWLKEKVYGPAARKAWLALIQYIDEKNDLKEVCEGTNKMNNHQYYLDRKRNTGDLHGQAPLLWCATALLK